ncbi:hypothetical protein Tco_1428549 [Tanacetum coccineum]
MRKLREDTFFGNKDEDAHDHIDRVLSIVGLFNIPGVSKDADLLKKSFIQRYCPPSITVKQLEDIHNFKQEGDESLYQAWERYNDLLYKCLTHDINSHQKVNIFYKGLSTMNRQFLDSQGPIPRMTPAQALITIQTMVDHSQKWRDGTTSRNIGSSSSNDGLAALVNKLDNLGRNMMKLKESVHEIQVGCQICEGPHLDKDCPLNEEVKQVEEVRYGEFGQTAPFNGNNGGKFRVGPPGYYTKTDNHPPYGERRQSLEELLAKHQEESAQRSTEMEVWIKKLQENAEINTRNQNASLKNLETQIEQLTEELCSRNEKSEQAKEENTNDQLPTKESNPGHFTLPCTIRNFNFYAMADLGASVNVKDSVWIERYSKWCNKNSHDEKPRPRDYTFKEWVKLKKGHLDISKSVRKDLFRLWVIGQFTKALDVDKDPLERCLDEYNWIKCKGARCKNKDWWYDYWYEDEEKTKLGSEDYNPPMVHIETFEVTKYKFNNGCSFICVSGENNETLSLGRKNGSRFRKMIMEEIEEVLRNDEEDSHNKRWNGHESNLKTQSRVRRQLLRPARLIIMWIKVGFVIEPNQEGLISVVSSDNSNDPLLELPEFESFHFDLDPSFPCPPPEPPDVKISLVIETNAPVTNNVDELNKEECFDPRGGEIDFSQNNGNNDSFTFVIWIFLLYLTYLVVSPLLFSTRNEDNIFDPDISI